MTKEIVPDPLNTKQQFRIPLRALLPLKEIGISRIADILNPGGTHIIDTSSLGNCSMRVKNRHKIALNRLTCLLCKPDMSTKEIMKINKTTPMSEVDRMVSSKHTGLITASLHNKNTNKDLSGALFTAPTIEETFRKYMAIQNNNTYRGNKMPRRSHDSVNHEATIGELNNHDVTISNNNGDEQRNTSRPKMNNKKRQAAAYNCIAREGLEIDINLDAPPHHANTTKVAAFWTNH